MFDIKTYQCKWYLENCEQQKEKSRENRLANPERVKEYGKEWRAAHREEAREATKKWSLVNSEKKKTYQKQYCQSSEGKEASRKHNAKRRQLGFVPLNEYFIGSSPHHIDKEKVIYMPTEIHKGNWHSVTRNINMQKINDLAWNYVYED